MYYSCTALLVGKIVKFVQIFNTHYPDISKYLHLEVNHTKPKYNPSRFLVGIPGQSNVENCRSPD